MNGEVVMPFTGRFIGFCDGEKVLIAPNTPEKTICAYGHEQGHNIGDRISFKEGGVLTPDEVKGATIEMTEQEREYFSRVISSKKEAPYNALLDRVGRRIYLAFLRNNEEPPPLPAIPVTQKEINEAVLRSRENLDVVQVDDEGKFSVVNSSRGRDIELPAVYTGICFLRIFENSLRRYGVLGENDHLCPPKPTSPAHKRAQNIVDCAFKEKGWRIPSLVDIKRTNGS